MELQIYFRRVPFMVYKMVKWIVFCENKRNQKLFWKRKIIISVKMNALLSSHLMNLELLFIWLRPGLFDLCCLELGGGF